MPADFVVTTFMALGEREMAWEWRERAVTERALWLVFLDVEARFDGFREDPRFADLKGSQTRCCQAADSGLDS